jgi:hypothetical protein
MEKNMSVEIDQAKFMTIIMEKTNKKLNEMQAQVLVLETQLQLVVDLNRELQEQLNKINKSKS